MTVAVDIPFEQRIIQSRPRRISCGNLFAPSEWSPSDESPGLYWIAIQDDSTARTAIDEAYEKVGGISEFWRTANYFGESPGPNLELVLSSGVYPVSESVLIKNWDEESDYRGFQPLNHSHKVILAEQVEIRTSELRRWKPSSTSYIDFDDDE